MEVMPEEVELSLANLLLPIHTVDEANFTNLTCESPIHPRLAQIRFWLVSFGSCLAIVGVFQNACLYILFTSRQKFRESACFFLAYVALFDAALDIGYLLCMTVQTGAAEWNVYTVHVVWWHYIKFILMLTKLCKLTSTLCLIAASTERYRAASLWTFQGFNGHTRFLMLIICIMCGCVLRGPQYIYTWTTYHPQCNGTARFRARVLLMSNISKQLHIIDTVLGIGLPFTALIYLNVAIVYRLHQQRIRELRNLMLQLAVHKEHIAEHDGRIKLVKLRHATRTLACLVLAYLLSNALDVVLALWEVIDRDSIVQSSTFHRLTGDMIWVCTVLGNVVRLPIYASCDPEILRALKQLCCQSRVPPSALRTYRNGIATLVTMLKVSTTSLDNIEAALHQEEAISRLRRLSRVLNEYKEDDPRRLEVQEKLFRTMSALHLNQPETISSTYALQSDRTGDQYLNVYRSTLAVDPGVTASYRSPRKKILDLNALFLPDIDLYGSHEQLTDCSRLRPALALDASWRSAPPDPREMATTSSTRRGSADNSSHSPSPVTNARGHRLTQSLNLPKSSLQPSMPGFGRRRPVHLALTSLTDRLIDPVNTLSAAPVDHQRRTTTTTVDDSELATTPVVPNSNTLSTLMSRSPSLTITLLDLPPTSNSSRTTTTSNNEPRTSTASQQVDALDTSELLSHRGSSDRRSSSMIHPSSSGMIYPFASMMHRSSPPKHIAAMLNRCSTHGGGAANAMIGSARGAGGGQGSYSNGHVPLLVITKADFDTDAELSDEDSARDSRC